MNSELRDMNMAEKPSILLVPLDVAVMIWENRVLIFRLALRELSARWRGTLLGVFWSLVTPLLTFIVYSFAFGVIFRARWSGALAEGNYPLILFSGIVTFGIFSEVINRAPMLILENVSYVKKVIFPLEILSVISVLVSLSNAVFGFAVLLGAQLIILHSFPWTVLLIPFILLPYCFIALGISWMLSSLGVFLRDIRQLVPVLTSLLMFLTPVFYPTANVPLKYRWIVDVNPLTPTLNQMRQALYGAGEFNTISYAISWMLALACVSVGYFWFVKTRKAFADVL
jgi:lipopolysaccharide transport system permease protein